MKPSGLKAWHHAPSAEVLRLLEVNPLTGLAAGEVASRQRKFGPNRISPRRGTPGWLKLLQQFAQPLVLVLVVAAVLMAFLAEWVDAAVIFGVVFVNAIVGFIQEARAEHAIASLLQMVTTEATV